MERSAKSANGLNRAIFLLRTASVSSVLKRHTHECRLNPSSCGMHERRKTHCHRDRGVVRFLSVNKGFFPQTGGLPLTRGGV